MSPLRMQPSFTVEVPITPIDAVSKIRAALQTPELSGVAVAASMCIDYTIEVADRRFWSPHLSVQVSEAEAGSRLHCRFSPRPEIWTMFMAIYFVVLIVMFGASIYAYAQWWMGDRPWTLLILPAGVLVIATLHVASRIGQNLSADQMSLLRSRLDRTLLVAMSESAEHTDAAVPSSVAAPVVPVAEVAPIAQEKNSRE